MHKWWLIGIAGILCLASGCGNKTVSQSPDRSVTGSPSIEPTVAADKVAADTKEAQPLNQNDFFPNPLVSGTQLQPVPVPNLIPPTGSVERVPQVDSGRPDPFASLNYTPAVVVKSKSSAPAATAPAPTAPVAAIPTVALPQPPTAPVFPLPSLLPSTPSAVGTLPSVNVPAAPVKSDAETIEISGVVEVGGKTNVIVKVPSEQTSRYVGVGERLANGNVLIKRVEMGLEPVVILEQGGREIVRSIGSSSALVGAL